MNTQNDGCLRPGSRSFSSAHALLYLPRLYQLEHAQRRAKRLCLWTLFVMFGQFFVMDVDVASQLSAVRGENPTSFYSYSHAVLDEDKILRVFLQAQNRSGCALKKYHPRQFSFVQSPAHDSTEYPPSAARFSE